MPKPAEGYNGIQERYGTRDTETTSRETADRRLRGEGWAGLTVTPTRPCKPQAAETDAQSIACVRKQVGADYGMAVTADAPPIDVHFLDFPDKEINEIGARGIYSTPPPSATSRSPIPTHAIPLLVSPEIGPRSRVDARANLGAR
jgi:hypothetical protein